MHIYPEIARNPLLHVGITEPLRTGRAEIIAENPRGILTYCPAGKFHSLAAESISAAETLLAEADAPAFIMISNADFAPVLERFRFDHKMRCRQAAWLRSDVPGTDPRLEICAPDDRAFGRILETYRMDTPEELRRRREAGEIFFARDHSGEDVGFVGLHPEGCFGLLEVFPPQRGKGYGAALEKHIIRFCLEQGRIPYCQVDENNAVSLNLQRSLGLEITKETLLMCWQDS